MKDNKMASFESSAKASQNTDEGCSPPISKVGWDNTPSSQDQTEGMFKLITGRRQRGSSVQAVPDRSKHSQEDETQDIPELQDGSQVAAPPRIIAHAVPSLKELDNIMPFLLPFTYEGGIDLRPLISALTPVSQVAEEDTHWEPSSLLAEMTFKMNQNKEVLKCGTNFFEDIL